MNDIKQYANYHGYSDTDPFEVLEVRSNRKVVVREMEASRDTSWKPEIVPGGFSGHCTNQHRQRWNIESNSSGNTFAISKRKNGRWYRVGENCGRFIFSDKPVKFYDYNF